MFLKLRGLYLLKLVASTREKERSHLFMVTNYKHGVMNFPFIHRGPASLSVGIKEIKIILCYSHIRFVKS